MLRDQVKSSSIILYGLTLIVLASLLILRTEWVWNFIYIINISVLTLLFILNIIRSFIEINPLKKRHDLTLGLVSLSFALLLFLFPILNHVFLPMIYGLWALINSLAKFITAYAYYKDHIEHPIISFIDACIMLIFGLLLIFDPISSVLRLSYVAAAFFYYHGLFQLVVGINLLFNQVFHIPVKRFIRIPMPIFLSCLFPSRIYQKLENSIQTEILEADHLLSEANCLDVYFHLKKMGADALGHVDIGIDNTIYSYGNHDVKRQTFFNGIGDGVLIKSDPYLYLKNALNKENEFIVHFRLQLSIDQINVIKKRLADLLNRTLPWIPEGIKDSNSMDYANRIYKETHAQFFKFKSGYFKTYVAASTNCVQLVDYFLNSKSLGLFRVNGIITTGMYFDFLNSAYQQASPIQITRTMYHS